MPNKRGSLPFQRLRSVFRPGSSVSGADLRKVEEKRKTLSDATGHWLTLLREMEESGQAGDPRYETYYQAYVQARLKEQRVELELFNLTRGLST